jgi:hypothetical protein
MAYLVEPTHTRYLPPQRTVYPGFNRIHAHGTLAHVRYSEHTINLADLIHMVGLEKVGGVFLTHGAQDKVTL